MNKLFDSKSNVPKHIKGLDCNVKNCSYNDGECYCTAKRIHIGPISAQSTNETLCATFKPKQM